MATSFINFTKIQTFLNKVHKLTVISTNLWILLVLCSENVDFDSFFFSDLFIVHGDRYIKRSLFHTPEVL